MKATLRETAGALGLDILPPAAYKGRVLWQGRGPASSAEEGRSMRKSALALAASCLIAVALTGCYTAPVIPPVSGIYSRLTVHVYGE
jgi:hypothetical protein